MASRARAGARPGGAPVAVAVGLAALGGFWWFDGLAATREAYAESLARLRPYGYFLVANLVAAAVAVGPAVWVGSLACGAAARGWSPAARSPRS